MKNDKCAYASAKPRKRAPTERYSIEVSTGTIYLQKWDETSFASGATLLAFHRVLSDEQFRIVAMKALKRFWNTRPVTVSEARTLR